MPTITTTVTSAQATGAVTTVTTTEATPEVAAPAPAVEAAFALPKITSGHAWIFIKFQFKNSADKDFFTTNNFSGSQGVIQGAGCTQHVWEGTTPNLVYGLFTMETKAGGWKTINKYWGAHPNVATALAAAEWWEAHTFGDYDDAYHTEMNGWDAMPNGTMNWPNDTIATYNLNVIKPHSVVMVAIHQDGVPSFANAVPDFVSFSKVFTSSFAMGDIGGGHTVVIQVYDTGADLGRHGDHLTPWIHSGASPACVEWLTTTPLTNYAFGGLGPQALAAMEPYGNLANFNQVYPTLIAANGGDGTGGSHVVHYFKDATDAAAGKRAYNKVFQAARDGGANIGGTVTDYRGCASAISVIINWNTVGDWSAAHTCAYGDEDFQAVSGSWMHTTVEIYGSMTYELASTFPGWESLGSVVFRDTPTVYTSVYPVETTDDPVEVMQFIDVEGDWQKYTDFFLDPATFKLTHEHRATFVVTKYGENKAKLYFRFPNSQSFADYWTEAAKGDTLTGVVENGKKIEVWFWGNYNPASRDVIALYEAMPQFAMHEVRADTV